MNTSELIRDAQDRAGLDDFGGDSFREGLEVLVRSAEDEAQLDKTGTEMFRQLVIGLLVNRLEVTEWYRRHPEIDEEEVLSPLFGVGLPRSSTTQLIFLLAQDPAARVLRWWEAEQPCPPPESATELSDPRIAALEEQLAWQDEQAPQIKRMVPISATGPTECMSLLYQDFRNQGFEALVHVPSYGDWVLNCNMESAYGWHKKVLKLLQWHCPPKRWRLKSPTHMFSLDALNSVYPDARFVMTHRDPVRAMPSLCSVWRASLQISTSEIDLGYLGQHALEIWSLALERLMQFRSAVGENRFYDIAFWELQTDPIEALRGLYAWLGEELSPEVEQRVLGWQKENERDKYGTHEPRLDEYGLDSEVIQKRFQFYTERYADFLTR
jgi:hypothetical protein